MNKKVKLSLNKTMVSRLQNNEQNSIWGETAPATWWILRKPRLSINDEIETCKTQMTGCV